MLGYDGPLSDPHIARVSLDPNYMVVDIVTNWAAEGLVLCFIHATAEHDSEDLKKSEWTNWCGTPVLDMQQIHRLYHALLMYIPQGNMTRVFQILSNSQERALLVSWPPDPVQSDPGPSGRDFAKLVETVEFGASPGMSDAKTTCARRYRSIRPLPLFADTVESIFVPHGKQALGFTAEYYI